MVLSVYQVAELFERRDRHTTALSTEDLGLSKVQVELTEEGVRFPSAFLTWDELEAIGHEPTKCFLIEGGQARPIQAYSETTGWMRVLSPTPGAPTMLVSGIPMHRIKDMDPIADIKLRMAALGRVKGMALDTATGLGYSAIALARLADRVVTIELDPVGIEIARLNPWSRELFGEKIEQRLGDAVEVVATLGSATFSAVFHDPPTIALAGELYGRDFYTELHRVLRRGGRLFHYIGDPNSGIGKRVYPGVMKRLGEAGFVQVKRALEAYGVTAVAG